MKNLKFILLILFLSISAEEKGRDSVSEKGKSNTASKSAPAKEKPYKEFPTDAKKGIQIVSEEDQKNWSGSKRVALIVGVSSYPLGSGLSRLNFGASDSQKMASVLHDVGRFDEVVLLNDEIGISNPALSPKKENIIRERDRLLSMNPHLFLFYFSGHGFELKGDNVVTPIDTVMGKDKEEPKNVLNIAKEIIDEAKSYKAAKQAKAKKTEEDESSAETKEHYGVSQVIVFLDACRETLRDGRSGSGVKFSEFPERIRSAKGVGIFIGTSPGGYSYEDGKLGGGVFTHYIVQGMSGEVQNKGGEYVTFNDLKNYVETEMAEYIRKKGKNEQAPYAKGDYTGDFLLAVGRPDKEVRVDALQYRSKSGDRVDSKRIYDSKGRKLRLSFHNISDDGNIYPAALDGISQIVFKYNDKCFGPPAPHEGREGRDCFEAHQFDRQGNLDFRYAVRYNPERGWEIRRAYRDEPGTRKADRTDKEDETIQYQRLEFDFNGNPILNEYQGEYIANKATGVPEERPLTDREGIARVVQNFDLLSNKTLEEYYDSERKLKPNKQSIARTIFAYDSIGNPILKIYTNERGRQAKDSFGISKISYAYDYSKNPYGILLEKAQFGKSEEELAEGEDGLSRYEYKYNEECLKTFSKTKEDSKNFHCVEEISFRGKDDQYKGNDKKIALSKFQYDEKGRITEEKYFRNTEQPMFVKHGITGFKYKYDETCWSFLKEVHPELLVPKCRETDSTCKSKEELAHTCVNETRTFNSANAPEADYDGIAVYKYRYDSGCIQYMTNKKECITVSETLDIREKPTLYPKERTVVHYDEACLKSGTSPRNCKVMEEFYGVDGKLIENDKGYARTVRQYDEACIGKGHDPRFCHTLDEYYGADGKLKENEYGYARNVSQYDEKGNQTLEEFYGADGKLKEKHGYAKHILWLDDKGNLAHEEYYETSERLIESGETYGGNPYSYARKVSKFSNICIAKRNDSKECLILEEFYGRDGKLKENGYGYARYVRQYDNKGNLTLHEYYGADEKLKEHKDYGYSRYTRQYDEKGRQVLFEYYGADGTLKENKFGYARNVVQYNEDCILKGYKAVYCRTLEEYYGADGKLKEHKDYRIARFVKQYDDKGNQTLEEFYGADRKLKENGSGYARNVRQYDEKGNETILEYYGAEGKLKEHKDYGYARNVRQYDEKGNETIIEYYGAEGKLKKRTLRHYDEACISNRNKPEDCYTLKEHYGADGKLKEHRYGYARIVRQYDEKGNRTLEEYYGEDETLKEPKYYGYARMVSKYDEKGNPTLVEFYGADGKLKEEKYGNARQLIQYNEPCLSKSKEHIEKNRSCISYQERYDQNEVIIVADKNIFNSSGEFVEEIPLNDLIGTKKWNHTENRFRFEEKIESVKEKRTVQKDGKFEEEEVSFPVLKDARYYMEFPNPKGSEGKRKVVVELDRLYRPVGVRFE